MRVTAQILFIGGLLLAGEAERRNPPPQDIRGLIAYMAKDDFAGKVACEKLVEIGEPAVDALLEALNSRVPRVRYWSAAAVARIADERAYKPLIETLRKDPNALVRATIVWHLRHFKKEEVYDIAVERLRDKNKFVRYWAMKVLEADGRKDKLPEIVKLTKHSDRDTRHDALVIAVRLGGNAELPLIREMALKDPDPQVRAGALRSLTTLPEKTPEILDIMILALKDPVPEVQEVSARLLAKGTNQSFGFDPSRPKEKQLEAIAKWRKWYEENKNKLKWSKEKRRFVTPEEESKLESPERRTKGDSHL